MDTPRKMRTVEQRVMSMTFENATQGIPEEVARNSLSLKIQARLQFDNLCAMDCTALSPHQLKTRWELMRELIDVISTCT